MKVFKIVLVLVLCLVVCNSCKKAVVDFNNIMVYKVDGTSKATTALVATYYSVTVKQVTTSDLSIIGGSNTGADFVSIELGTLTAGTYDVSSGKVLISYGPNASPSSIYYATTGSVTITKFADGSVSGTFQFTGTNSINSQSKVITDGAFKCPVTQITK